MRDKACVHTVKTLGNVNQIVRKQGLICNELVCTEEPTERLYQTVNWDPHVKLSVLCNVTMNVTMSFIGHCQVIGLDR